MKPESCIHSSIRYITLIICLFTSNGCSYLPGSGKLCNIQLSSEETSFDLHLKRAYHDVFLVLPAETYNQVGDTMVQATVTNTGKTTPKIGIQSGPQEKGSYTPLAPGDTVQVYSGPLRKFGISFASYTLPGSKLSVHLTFAEPLREDYAGELRVTWGAP